MEQVLTTFSKIQMKVSISLENAKCYFTKQDWNLCLKKVHLTLIELITTVLKLKLQLETKLY